MAIARFPTFVIDCPDPGRLAAFYAELLGWEAQADEPGQDWIDVKPADGSNCLSFQQVEGYRAPEWPGQKSPQQMHLDVLVDDLHEAEKAVVALGATKAETQPGTTFRVFLDPAGHPFCLCLS